MESNRNRLAFSVAITTVVFWVADFAMHNAGVGETNYYYLSKLGNAVLFATLFFTICNYREHWKRLAYAFAFGTWISFYYLASSYTGLVQWLGIYARYTPPPFIIGSLTLSPFLWWVFHSVAFFIGIELAERMNGDNLTNRRKHP